MADLSSKTVAELRIMAREREIASRSEINKARKATLLEWLEGTESKKNDQVETSTNQNQDQTSTHGELFNTTVESDKFSSSETTPISSSEPDRDSSSTSSDERESSSNTLTLILVGLAILALVLYLYD